MAAPFEPESLAELTRYIQYILGGLERQLTELSAKVDKIDVVSKEQHRTDLNSVRAEVIDLKNDTRGEITELKEDMEKFQHRLTSHGRWLVGSVIVPILGFLIALYATIHGFH